MERVLQLMLHSEMANAGIIARAFELARGGTCRTVSDIRNVLAREGFTAVDAHLSGAAIRKQIKEMLAAAR